MWFVVELKIQLHNLAGYLFLSYCTTISSCHLSATELFGLVGGARAPQ